MTFRYYFVGLEKISIANNRKKYNYVEELNHQINRQNKVFE